MPVSSFAPEFLELFKSAAQEEVILPIGDTKRATHLRFRLHMLRRDMRKEQHTLTTIANSVQFLITPEGNLRCVPADESYLSAFKEAGIEISEVLPSPSGTPLSKVERADATEVVKNFLKSGENK